MIFYKTILIIFIFLNLNAMHAQSIKSYKWENRVLLVFASEANNALFKNQIEELKPHGEGFKNRKLIVFQIQKEDYKMGLSEKSDWQKSNNKFIDYRNKKSDFEVVLVGLDGGVKLRETKLVTCKSLFKIIDVMPIRQSELNDD